MSAGRGFGAGLPVHEAQKAALQMPVIMQVIAQGIRVLALFRVAGNDMHVAGHRTLQAGQHDAVAGQLDEIARLGPMRQLGVHHLVTEGAKFRRPLDPAQEVGVAKEPAVAQRRLVDDVRTVGQRLAGGGQLLIPRRAGVDLDHAKPTP